MSSYVPPSFLFFFFLLLRRFPGENVDISRYNLLPSLPHPSSPINKDHVLLEKKKKKKKDISAVKKPFFFLSLRYLE